jgi:hypothetical protein
MSQKYPTFRMVHHDEADHHAMLVCKKKGLREGTKKFKEAYNQAFIQYINDAKESLYPSGELSAGQNPTKERISSMEKIRRRNKIYGKLTKQQFDKMTASKEWKNLSKLSLLKYDHWDIWIKHINRGSQAPSELEEKQMKNLRRRVINHLKKDESVTDPIKLADEILLQSKDKFKNNYERLMKKMVARYKK